MENKKMTIREALFRAIESDEGATLDELLQDRRDINRKTAQITLARMIEAGIITRQGDQYYTLRPYDRVNVESNQTIKREIYMDMLEIYLVDFVSAGSFDNRVKIGREMRLLIEAL